jgi:hypothetical protein
MGSWRCSRRTRSEPTTTKGAQSPAGPSRKGVFTSDATGGFTAGLLAVAFFPFLSAILVLILGHNPALERGAIPEGAH